MTKMNPKYNSYLQHVVATVGLESVSKEAEERFADVQEDLEVTDVKGNKGVRAIPFPRIIKKCAYSGLQ